MLPYEKDNKKLAQELRKNMTKEEKLLWFKLFKNFPYPVKRQKCIGNYIVDFYIPRSKCVIEIDGSQHYEPENRVADSERDKSLNGLGLTVLRYTNFDVQNNLDGVATDILNHIGMKFEDLNFERDFLNDIEGE